MICKCAHNEKYHGNYICYACFNSCPSVKYYSTEEGKCTCCIKYIPDNLKYLEMKYEKNLLTNK